jgi:hypothetical protein
MPRSSRARSSCLGPPIIEGMGFSIGHSVAIGWVGRLAAGPKGHSICWPTIWGPASWDRSAAGPGRRDNGRPSRVSLPAGVSSLLCAPSVISILRRQHRARHVSRDKIRDPARRSGNQRENETSRDFTASLGLNGNTTIHGDHAVDERPLKRPARIRRCHPVGEIIAEFQAVVTWSGERRNSLRRRDW